MNTFNLSCLKRPSFCQFPISCDIPDERISTQDVALADYKFNPHDRRAWILGDISGALCLVWADCECDAWDEAADAGFLDHLQMEESDATELNRDGEMVDKEDIEIIRAGNASEPFHVDQAWMVALPVAKHVDIMGLPLLIRIAKANGEGVSILSESRI